MHIDLMSLTPTPIAEIYLQYIACHRSICTDTRQLKPGALFVALKGEHFDGNTYAQQAIEQGAGAALVSEPSLAMEASCLYVPDTLKALQELARYHRRTLCIPIIGITGTNGKTTTKELSHAVLSRRYKVLATEGNLNNHIGVPLTLLKIKPEHELAIVEMGANKPGDIEELVNIAEPTVGLITNIGQAHLEGFGSLEGVLETKSELAAFLLEHGGRFILNRDDAMLCKRWQGQEHFSYSSHPDVAAQLKGKARQTDDPSQRAFMHGEVSMGEETWQLDSLLVGQYNLTNALAAISLGHLMGVPISDAVEAITSYHPGNKRSQLQETAHYTLIIDAYNANLSSMTAALSSLKEHREEEQSVCLILGDMLELGSESSDAHRKVLQQVKEMKPSNAYLIGKEFEAALMKEESPLKGVYTYATVEDLIQEWKEKPQTMPTDKSCILIKGSRGMALEKCLPLLSEE